MTKPDDVPQDVWIKACLCAGPATNGDPHAMQCKIAYAIIEEREACAQVIGTLAEVIRDEVAGDGRQQMHQSARAQVNVLLTAATAIRDRS